MRPHPMLGGNKLKLGVFSFNGGGGAFTNHPDRFEPTWDNNVQIAQLADQLGFEALVPYAKWKGFGGDGHYSGRTFETFTWAAALASLTKNIAVMSTVHVPVYQPLLAAKLTTTVDHISGGRAGINIVCGWFKPETDMFGSSISSHEDRYGAADEWVQLVEKLWTERTSFDFKGKFYDMKQAFSDPKPLGRRPLLMNAGGSDRGKEFAAKNCDVAFILPFDPRPDAIRTQVEGYRLLARERHGREIQVWTFGYCVQRQSIAEAKAYVDEYAAAHGDTVAADSFITQNVANAKTVPPGVMEKMRYSLMAGIGSYPLLGNAEDIAATLGQLSDAGLDGMLLMWMDYYGGLQRFGQSVLPRLERAGYRANTGSRLA